MGLFSPPTAVLFSSSLRFLFESLALSFPPPPCHSASATPAKPSCLAPGAGEEVVDAGLVGAVDDVEVDAAGEGEFEGVGAGVVSAVGETDVGAKGREEEGLKLELLTHVSTTSLAYCLQSSLG